METFSRGKRHLVHEKKMAYAVEFDGLGLGSPEENKLNLYDDEELDIDMDTSCLTSKVSE